ncbi:MAG: antitoxin [Deltaproteobacteria bacterium]|nr:antitoxin [Deltaproteobacteria bacterium]
MKRSQLYLTEEQRARIGRRAEDAGVSQAEVVRQILDEALDIDEGSARRLAAVDATSGILPKAPDWPEWLASVRGRSAGDRLRELGL